MAVLKSGTLFSPLNGAQQSFSIVSGNDRDNSSKLKSTWQVPLFGLVVTAKKTGMSPPELSQFISAKGIEDFHWDWEALILKSQKPVGYEEKTFYLESANRVQGVLHAFIPKKSRLSYGDSIIYVDRVAVAPWNRQTLSGEKELKGVGSALLSFICSFSKLRGYKGCVGLHSLPQAERFYLTIGMNCLGEDPSYSGLKYFEFGSVDSSSFVGGVAT